ncbi:prolyl oligopeptidase family serine peptidase [Planococcus sp. 1R117A]|uniref:prolyl oligopeptidase family serine peptidase n=1 Tax=Planococcus sp. 1R117A TaxID=3447020 RepID=UPI003EDB988D
MIAEHEVWNEIPLLHVYPEGRKDESLPTAVFFHGHMSAKEHNLHYAYQMAEKGMRVLLPDALLHGEREEGLDEVQMSLRFWEIVLTSIEELAYIHEKIHEKQLAKGEIGVGGTSMGGITTLGALTVYPWIKAAAVMMGAANYVQLAKAQMAQFESKGFKLPITDEERKQMLSTLEQFDATKNKRILNKRPLFFWHGEQDTTVPFSPTYSFFKALKDDYEEVPEHLHFMNEREAGHAVSRPGMLAATEWLARHIAQ